MDLSNHLGKYDLVYADPAWRYYGSETKNGACGKHYATMAPEEIAALPVKDLFRDPKHGAVFLWATCPLLDVAIDTGKEWGLYYRGVAFNWVKTRKDGGIIGAQGVPPTATKPTSELCLLFTTCSKGRPFKIESSKVPQVVPAPRGQHSEKPACVRDSIVQIYGDRPRIELFSRHIVDGWDRVGNEVIG